MTRIAIVGAGAMGGLFAAHLASAGAEVWVYDRWREHIEAIARVGLRIRRGRDETTIRVHATGNPAEAGVVDVAMFFIKFRQTRAASEDARPMIGPRTMLVTLQNGLGNVDVIRSVFSENRLLFGLTTLTSELLGPGYVEASYQGHGETYLWPENGHVDAESEHLRSLLMAGGINATFAPDIELKIWNKLIVNCCLNTVCAITGLRVGALTDRPEAWTLLDAIADEIVAVAKRKGIPIDRSAAHAFLRSVAREARDHDPSMLIDVRNGRPTEIECLNGAVLRDSKQAGIEAPYNAAVYTMIRVIEQSYATREPQQGV